MVKKRLAHLQLPPDIQRALNEPLPAINENVFDEDDLEDLDDYVPDRPVTRSARTRECGDAPPNQQNTREDDLPSTEGDKERSGIGEFSPETTQEGDQSPAIREARNPSGSAEPDGTATLEGDAPPEAELRRPLRENTPENTCEARGRLNPNKHLCTTCGTLIKLIDGRRTCVHRTLEEKIRYQPKRDALDLITEQGDLYGTIAYVRGLQEHPLRDVRPFVAKLETALDNTNTMLPPSRESTSEEEEQEPEPETAYDASGSDTDSIPPYNVIAVEPIGDVPPTHDTYEGDAPPGQRDTCEDDLPSTEGDKERSGLGEYSPELTQEGDLPPTEGDEARSGIGENAPEPTQGGDVPPQTTHEGPGRPRASRTRISAADFAAILAAARAGPGHSTQSEAPPTASGRPSPEVEDGQSPLKTRQGTIRGPPAPPKRRQPPNN